MSIAKQTKPKVGLFSETNKSTASYGGFQPLVLILVCLAEVSPYEYSIRLGKKSKCPNVQLSKPIDLHEECGNGGGNCSSASSDSSCT